MLRLLAVALLLVATGALGADPDALWKIVDTKCAPAARRGEAPLPCASVDLARGMAVLKDNALSKPYHFLVIPIARVIGMEDPAVLGAGDAFAVGWETRALLEAKLGRAVPREAVALAVNSRNARSQNQLHLHVDCLDPAVRQALAASPPGPGWAPFPAPLAGTAYLARFIPGETLEGVNPFRLLAERAEGPLGDWTLVAAGATDAAGRPGFVLLANNAPLAHGEQLQDATCHGS
jgi:CDP-diacylglycerol pyrophosphatase